MTRVAVFGPERGLISAVLRDYELSPVLLPRSCRELRAVDLFSFALKPRSQWQAAFVRHRFEETGSKVMISLIDNTEFFGYCSSISKGRRTIAIQNGLRLPDTEWEYSIDRFKRMRTNQCNQHDIYVAWGSWDANRYLKLGGSAREIVIAGSLADALHRKNGGRLAEDHLIGALEMRSPKHFFYDALPFPPRNRQVMASYSQSVRILYSHLTKFCHARGIKPLFILNSTHDQLSQIELLNSLYFGECKIHYDHDNSLASYDAVASCRVIVGVLSSLLVEAFGRGKKMLALNASNDADINFPIEGVWALSDPRYEAFEERLELIMQMSDLEWGSAIGQRPEELVGYDQNYPTDLVIRDLVSTHA